VAAPEDVGIWLVNLNTGYSALILSIADVVKIPQPGFDLSEAMHWFNHLLFNTSGSRFGFLHRWRKEGQRGFSTRMITATPEGKDLFILDPSGHTSHFIWRDAEHILAWTQPEGRPARFYLFEDKTRQVEVVGENVMTGNGHCSYLPGNEWILNDTYPDKEGKQHVYLYHVASQKKVLLGSFFAPPEYRGEWRCDTHPRFSPDGRSVVIDSAHGGNGRQMYLIDITRILA
jgi:Tol biopolymer transport system component